VIKLELKCASTLICVAINLSAHHLNPSINTLQYYFVVHI